MIRQRVCAGLKTIKGTIAEHGKFTAKSGVVRSRLGRPGISERLANRVRAELALGHGILKVARTVGVGNGTVQKIKRAMV